MKLTNAVAIKVNSLMKEHNITQYRLSALSGIPQTTLSSLRKVRSSTVKLSTIYGICCAFELELVDFFDDPIFKMSTITD